MSKSRHCFAGVRPLTWRPMTTDGDAGIRVEVPKEPTTTESSTQTSAHGIGLVVYIVFEGLALA